MKQRLSPQEMFPQGEPDCRVRHVRLANELNVRVVEFGDESGLPLMLVHGWGCTGFAFHKNVAALAKAGRRVILPDLQGHGLSDKPTSASHYSTSSMVQHVGQIADALGLKKFAIGGHSMGAALALRFAIANPRRVGALALISPVGTSGLRFLPLVRLMTPAVALFFWRMLNTRWMTHFFLRLAYGRHGAPGQREIDEYWAPSQFPEFTAALRHLLHRLNWGPIYIGGLDAYDIPILVISGSRDHLCRRRTINHIRKAMRCNPQVIRGAGHLVQSETPDAVNAAIVGLLAQERR